MGLAVSPTMELLQSAGQLIGVLVGALLTGAASVLRSRAERKRLIARALSDLLEVRHQLIGIDLILAEIRKRFQLPSEAIQTLRGLFDSIWPIEPELHKRYDEAVNLLAGVDPIFAFYLRSKTAAPSVLGSLRAVALHGGASPADIETLEQSLSSLVIPGLNAAALTLGRHHSILTWWRVRRLVKNSGEIPPQVAALIEQAQALAISNSGNENVVADPSSEKTSHGNPREAAQFNG